MAERLGSAVLELTTNKDDFLREVGQMAGGSQVLQKSFGAAKLEVKAFGSETTNVGKAMTTMTQSASSSVGKLTQTGAATANVTSQFKQLGATAPGVLIQIADAAKKPQSALDKLMTGLSGGRVIEDAHQMTAAVNQLGGAATLTAKEQAQVNAQVREAIDKYRALGQTAPPALLAIETATRPIPAQTDKLTASLSSGWSTATKFAGVMGITLGAGALVSFGKSVLDRAGEIGDMASQLDVSAEKLQRWGYAARLGGSSMDAVGKAVETMEKQLAGGRTDSLDWALSQVGMNFRTLREMRPEDAFEAIVAQIQRIPDPMTQARVTTELFGDKAAKLLPAIKAGFKEVGAQATVMSDDVIAGLKEAQDQWAIWGDNIIVISANVMKGVLDTVKFTTSSWKNFFSAVVDVLPGGTGGISTAIDVAVAKAKQPIADVRKGVRELGVDLGDFGNHAKDASHDAEQLLNKLIELEEKYSGMATDQDIAVTAQAIAEMGGASEVAADQLPDLVEQIEKWRDAGHQIPPVLKDVVERMRPFDLAFTKVNRNVADGVALLLRYSTTVRGLASQPPPPPLDPKFIDRGNDGYKSLFKTLDELGTRVYTATQPPPKENWIRTFDEMSRAAETFGHRGGAAAQFFSQGLGSATSMLGQLDQAAATFSAGGLANMTAGMVEGATATFSFVLNLSDAINHMQKAEEKARTFNSTLTGVGSDFASDFGQRIGDVQTRLKFSDELLNKIIADEALVTTRGASGDTVRQRAELLHLSEIMQEGGLTADNFDDLATRATGLFDIIKLGGRAAKPATEELGKVLEMFGAKADEMGGLWSQAFKDLITQSQAAGVAIEQTTALVAAQRTKLTSGSSNLAKDLAGSFQQTFDRLTKSPLAALDQELAAAQGNEDLITEIEARKAKVIDNSNKYLVATTQQDFDRVNRIILASFNTSVASGSSLFDAIGQIGPGFDALVAAAEKFGFAGSDAFETLKRYRSLTTVLQPVIDQFASLSTIAIAQANLNGLTADSFADIQAQGRAAYQQLLDGGMTAQEAELAEKGFLETIVKLHKDKGLAIDEATQKLIDQAEADGVLSEQEESTQQTLREGLGTIIQLLGGDLPEAWEKMADKGELAAKKLKDDIDRQSKEAARAANANLGGLSFDVPVSFSVRDLPSGAFAGDIAPPSFSTPEVPGFATGTQGRFVNFGRGTLAMLHGWEAVTPVQDVSRGMPTIGGGAASRSPVEIHQHYHGPDAEGWRRLIRSPSYRRELRDAILDNAGGLGVELAGALDQYR